MKLSNGVVAISERERERHVKEVGVRFEGIITCTL
jgi:hypothetical protein